VPPVRTTISCRVSTVLNLLLAFVALLSTAAEASESILPLSPRWSIDLGGPPVAGASPVSDDHHVYVALRSGQLAAFDLGDGRPRWRTEFMAVHPVAVDAGQVFVATEDAIHALRGEDGAIVWEHRVSISAPLLAQAGWLIALADGKVFAFRESDGASVWERDVGAVTERPTIEGDRLYVSLSDGRVLALQMATGDQVWERRLGGAPEASLVTGDRVYVGASDRLFYCLNAKDGEILWNQRVGSAPEGLAAADESRIFTVSLDNVLRAYDRRSGNQRWQHPVKRRAATGPVALGSIVLVASASSAEIWAWTATGKAAGVIATPAEPAVPPAFLDRGTAGAFVFVVTGGLANQWQLTLIATAGDPALVPLSALPGQALELKR
jgi:outer membrane protein assembly factor BamB